MRTTLSTGTKLSSSPNTPAIGHALHVTGIDELLSQIRRVLDNAVALMQMNDRGLFTAAGLAEKTVNTIVDANGSEHVASPNSYIHSEPSKPTLFNMAYSVFPVN